MDRKLLIYKNNMALFAIFVIVYVNLENEK